MSTLRKLVSDVRGMHKLLSGDNLINDRTIASEIKINTIMLVKRETNLRKLWATDTLFTTIPCLEMIEVPISECCAYQDECNISRTKYKIPRISEGNYQYLIQGVYSINALGGLGTKFDEITINRYINLLSLPIIKKEDYFIVLNDYIYVTNPNLLAIRIAACFEEDIPNEILYPKEGCGDCQPSIEELCRNPLDKQYILPGYLEKQVLELTSQKLLNTYYKVKTDLTENNIDAAAPNAPANS